MGPSKGATTSKVTTPTIDCEIASPNSTPGRPASTTGDDYGCGETLIGIVLLVAIALVIFVVSSVFAIGAPASYLCVGALACAGIAYVTGEIIKEADAKHKRVAMTIAAGLVGDVTRASLWTAAGLAIVWAFLLFLNLVPNLVVPDQAADLQLGAYDMADRLKSMVTPGRFLVVIAVAVAIAVVAGTVWPINAAGTAKKWIGIAALLLLTFANVTFVAVRAGSDRYDEALEPIRAQIGEDLQRLRDARRDHAALQWVGATLQRQIQASPRDAEAWREYLTLAADHCDSAEQEFEEGYYSDPRRLRGDNVAYCRVNDYLPKLVERQFRGAPAPGTEPSAIGASLWLPEFPQLAITASNEDNPFETFEVASYPRRVEELKALAKQVDRAAADQERARDRVEATVVALVSSMVGDAGAGVADQVLARMKETVLKALVREGRERVALWLRLKDVPLPDAIGAILAIEPELRLESPRAAMESAGGAQPFVLQTWYRSHRATADLRQLGREAAIEYPKEVARRQKEAADAAERAQANKDRIESARRAGEVRVP